MKFSAILAAGFAAVAYAVKITNGPADFVGLKVGSTFKITWSDAVGPVTLTLQHGDPNNLQTVQVISSGLSSGEFDWPIPNLPVDSAYAIRIDDSTGVPNWSVPFAITGGSGSFTSGTASASASVSSTASGSTSAPSSTGSTTSSVSSATTSASTSESTTASSSSKTTSSSATTTAAKPTTTVPNNNDARRFSSPLALVLVTVAALVYFN